jgi:hypothetical protein
MGLLGSLRGKQGGDAIRQSTTTATMHLLEQNRKFEAFMRDKVATLERQVAEDDGRLNRAEGGGEDGLVSEADLAADLGVEGPGEGQAAGASFPARTGHEGVAVIGDGPDEFDEELKPPEALPPAYPTAPVSPPLPPSPPLKASGATPDWRAFLAGASTAAAPGALAAGADEPATGDGAQGEDVVEEEALVGAEAGEPPAGEGGQVDAQGEDIAEEEAPAEVEASGPSAGGDDRVGAQGEDIAEEEAPAEVEASGPAAGHGDQVGVQDEEEEGGGGGGDGLFGMSLPIVSATSVASSALRQPPATAPSAAVPSASPSAVKASPPAPASDVATQGPDADDQSSDGWDQAGLQDGQVGSWA